MPTEFTIDNILIAKDSSIEVTALECQQNSNTRLMPVKENTRVNACSHGYSDSAQISRHSNMTETSLQASHSLVFLPLLAACLSPDDVVRMARRTLTSTDDEGKLQ